MENFRIAFEDGAPYKPNSMDEYPLAIALKKNLHEVVTLIINSEREDISFNIEGLINLKTSQYPDKEKVFQKLYDFINKNPIYKGGKTHL